MRLSTWLAAWVCLLFVATLRDAPGRSADDASPAPVPSVRADEPDRDARLVVLVKDAAGTAVAGATVRAFAMREGVAWLAGAATTHADGTAKLDALPRGETWLLVGAAGRSRASTRLVAESGERAVSLVVHPAASTRVTAVDDLGAAVAGATVEVRGADPLPFAATTDGAGAGSVERLPPPPWTVTVSAPGYAAVVQRGAKPGPAPLAFTLKKLGVLEVVVVDAEGKPAPRAAVQIAGGNAWPARSATVDDLGHARIAGLDRGVYDLRAWLGERVSAPGASVVLARGEIASTTVVLVPGRRVRARVTDGDKAITGAAVVLAEAGLSSFPLEATTGEGGVAVLGPIAPGPASLSARAAGFVERTAVAVPAIGAADVTIALVRGATLVGEVVDRRGNAIDGARIEVVGTDRDGEPIAESPERAAFRASHFAWALDAPRELVRSGELGVLPGPVPPIPHGARVPAGLLRAGGVERPPEPWVTRLDGTFRARPVPPGRVRAIAHHPGYVDAVSEVVPVEPGGEVGVRIVMGAGATLEGRVVDERRTPVAGARVDVAARRGTFQATTLTADDGTFAFAAVPDAIVLTVARPGSGDDAPQRVQVETREGKKNEVEIVLDKAREPMRVRVLDERGDALGRAQVTALSLAPEILLRRTAFTDDEGWAEIKAARGLPLRVEASLPGRPPVAKEVEAAPAELVLEVARGRDVTGVVTTRHGHDLLDGAEVTLYGAAGTRRAVTDRDGRFRITEVAPGKARLSARKKGYAAASRAIEIARGDPDRAFPVDSLDLASAGAIEGVVLDARGEPVVGARVAVGSVPAYVPLGRPSADVATTDADGAFHLDDVPEGEVAVEAYAPDRGRGRVTDVRVRADRTTTRVRVTLDPAAISAEPAAPGGVAVTLGERTGPGGVIEVVLVAVAPRSEAERAGLEPGDRIAAIDRLPPTTMRDARTRLSGPLGDDVIVEIERGGARRTLRVAREQVHR